MGYVQEIGMELDTPHSVEIHSLYSDLDWVGIEKEKTHEVTRKQRERKKDDSGEGEAAPDNPFQLCPRIQRYTYMISFVSYDLSCTHVSQDGGTRQGGNVH